MPSKKKKYNARFPAGRIKKIMQSDEEIGKVAQAVPVIISRTLELFVESLLTKTLKITNTRNAKTLSPTHLKQCIMAEQRFDFLRELVKNLPDISLADEAAANYDDVESSPEQDSFSDAATEHNHNQSLEMEQRPSTSMIINGESKLRHTRSSQQLELKQQQQHELWEYLQKTTFKGRLLRTESLPNAEVTCTPPKRARYTATTTTTTTTATITAAKSKQTSTTPIVSVQLDYSNIDWKKKKENKNVPQSAPAQIVQPMFDYSQLAGNQTPISINIDLSSININKSATTSTITSQTADAKCEMGTIPKATTTTTTPAAVAKPKDTLLELDEDYDNI